VHRTLAILSVAVVGLAVALLAIGRGSNTPAESLAAGNELITFTSDRTANNLEIFVMQPNGNSPQRVTNSALADYSPSWGCNNNLLFVRDAGGGNGNIMSTQPASGNWLTFQGGDGLDTVSVVQNAANDSYPSSTCGNNHIIFQRTIGLETNIWRYSEAAGEEQLTFNGMTSQPAISHDGSKIAYVQNGAVWVMTKDGVAPTQLSTPDDNQTDSGPAWSADDQQIGFSRSETGPHSQNDVGTLAVTLQAQERIVVPGDRWSTGLPAFPANGVEIILNAAGDGLPLNIDVYKGPFSPSSQTDPDALVPLTDSPAFDIEPAIGKVGTQSGPTPTPFEVYINVQKLDQLDRVVPEWHFNLHAGPGCMGASIYSAVTSDLEPAALQVRQPGSYSVREKMQDGWTALGPTCQDVNIPSGSPDVDLTFRNQRPAVAPTPTPGRRRISAVKLDADTGQGMAGWSIIVRDGPGCTGDQLGSDTTTFGSGEADDLYVSRFAPSVVYVQEVLQPGWEAVSPACQQLDFDLVPDGQVPVVTFRNKRVRGDVNCDGRRDAVDAALILQFDARLILALPCQPNGDVNNDGRIDAIDASILQQHIAGLFTIP
jgi:hypothetical protein